MLEMTTRQKMTPLRLHHPDTHLVHWHESCFDAVDLMSDNPNAGRELGLALLREATASANEQLCLSAQLVFAFAHYYEGNLHSAETAFTMLIKHVNQNGNLADAAFPQYGLMLVFHKRGRLSDVAELEHTGLILSYSSMKSTRLSIIIATLLGSVAFASGDANRALQHFYTALIASKAINKTSRIAQILMLIAEIFYLKGQLQDAEMTLLEAKNYLVNAKERWLQPIFSTLFAAVMVSLHKMDEAYLAIERYLANDERASVGGVSREGFCWAVAASAMADRGDMVQLAICCERAATLLSHDDMKFMPMGFCCIGQLHHQSGKLDLAMIELNEAIDQAEINGDIATVLRASEELVQIYAAQEKWREAYDELQRHQLIHSRLLYQASQIRLVAERAANEAQKAVEAAMAGIEIPHCDPVAEAHKVPELLRLSEEIHPLLHATLGHTYRILSRNHGGYFSSAAGIFIKKIQSNVNEVLDLSSAMADVARIDAGSFQMDSVHFSLDSVLDDVATVTSVFACRQKLAFYSLIPKDLACDLLGDPLHLAEVLVILVKNALTFTRTGEIAISVRQANRSYQRVSYEFVVRDTGCGMSASQVNALMEFFSETPSIMVGSGLYIARALVRMMGGKIELESQQGKGSTFRFTVNLGLATYRSKRFYIAPDLKKKRMLIVSDHGPSGAALMQIMTNLSLDVVHAQSAQRGFELLHIDQKSDTAGSDGGREVSQEISVVFIDLQASPMDGVQFIRELKRHYRKVADTLPRQPRLVLVGLHGNEDFSEKGGELVPDGFLSKPVTKLRVSAYLSTLSSEDAVYRTDQYVVPSTQFANLSVLVVDDNPINQQVMLAQLQAMGISVHAASSGKMALDILEKQDVAQGADPIGLIFLDLRMPEMSGIETAVMMRRDTRFHEIPIIGISAPGQNMAQEWGGCIQSGMVDMIAKPIHVSALHKLLSTVCSRYVVPSVAQRDPPSYVSVMSQSDVAPTLSQIAGVDVQAGMLRMQGDKTLYFELLMRFCEEHSGVIAELRSTSITQAMRERAAHSVKGVAALMGANTIRAQAEKLEIAYRENADPVAIAVLVEQCDEMWQVQLAELRRVFAQEAANLAQNSFVQLDSMGIQIRLQLCVDMLRDYNAGAFSLLRELSNQVLAAFGPEIHKKIACAARMVDFDAALEAILCGAQLVHYTIT